METALRRARDSAGLLRYVLRQSWTGMWRDDVPFYAAGIAFYSLFSIFALLFLLSILLGLVGANPDDLKLLVGFPAGFIPAKAEEFLNQVLVLARQPVPPQLLPLAIVALLWTSSNVVQALIHALNRIYHLQESRAAWRTRLMALAVVGTSSLFLVLGFVFLVFGEDLAGGAEEAQRLRGAVFRFVFDWSQPISVLIVFLAARLLYWLAPKFKHVHRVSWPGSVVFAVAWMVTTVGFNLYLRRLAVYDQVYGPMATVVVMLTWVYLSAVLVLVGGEVNAAVHRYRLQSTNAGDSGVG